MHGRMAKYTVSGDVHELARTAEDGMLPIFKSQPGFKAYSLMESGNEIISFSAWESAEDAEAANKAAASWIAENWPVRSRSRKRGSARSCSRRRSA